MIPPVVPPLAADDDEVVVVAKSPQTSDDEAAAWAGAVCAGLAAAGAYWLDARDCVGDVEPQTFEEPNISEEPPAVPGPVLVAAEGIAGAAAAGVEPHRLDVGAVDPALALPRSKPPKPSSPPKPAEDADGGDVGDAKPPDATVLLLLLLLLLLKSERMSDLPRELLSAPEVDC